MGDVIDVARDIQYQCTGRISCTCYRDTMVKEFKDVKNKFFLRMQVDNKPGVLAAIASVFGVHKVSISKVIQKVITLSLIHILRIENVKAIDAYIDRIDEMIERKGEWLWH